MAANDLLTVDDKQAIEDAMGMIRDLDWETGQFNFSEFIDNFELPQIIQTKNSWSGSIPVDRYVYLHTVFERYALIASPFPNQNLPKQCLLSDWCKGACRIISNKPVLKTRYWVFQSAFELFRFDFPRTIRILAEVPVHRKCSDNAEDPWVKVVLKRNAFLKAVRRCSYQSILPGGKKSEPREGFVLSDASGGEYFVPPAVPMRFSTEILNHELQEKYKSHDGDFTIPEILMRYEFPIDVSISLAKNNNVNLTLNSFCVVKSILAVMFGQHSEPEIVELSPETPLLVICPRCLTVGIPRDDDDEEAMQVEAAPDNVELQKCNNILIELNKVIGPRLDAYKGIIREAYEDELNSVQKAYELSLQIEKDVKSRANEQVYMTPEEAVKFMENESDGFPFDSPQPKSFTVHICADPANPYNETVDYEISEESMSEIGGAETDDPTSIRGKASVREALIMQYELQDPIPRQVFAQALEEIPNELLVGCCELPTESAAAS